MRLKRIERGSGKLDTMAPVSAEDMTCSSNGYSKKITVYHGTFIDTPVLGDLRVRTKTSVGVCEETGVIKFVTSGSGNPMQDALRFDSSLGSEDVNVVEYGRDNTFFFPGFIDTHIHASQYPNCGIFGNSTLLDWLETYTFPLESSLNDEKLALMVYDSVISQTLRNGTTCASYYTTIDSSSSKIMAKLCKTRGQRAFIGKVCMNQNCPDFYKEEFDQCKESSMDLINYILHELDCSNVRPIITPRFAITCSSDMMNWLSFIAHEFNLPIQTHLNENENEIKFIKEIFPNCDSYTDVYYKHGLLNQNTVLAHCIHLNEEEIKLLKKQDCGISHCPISNSSLTSGECKVRKLLDQGLKVGLGSDVSGGYTVSILENARQALLVSRHLAMPEYDADDDGDDDGDSEHCKLSISDVLYLATMGGARVLNLDSTIGTFDVGKKFDTQLIDLSSKLSRIDIFPWQSANWSQINDDKKNNDRINNLIAKWVFNGDDRNVIRVWVDGKLCHDMT